MDILNVLLQADLPIIPPPLPVPPWDPFNAPLNLQTFWELDNLYLLVGALQSVFILSMQNYVFVVFAVLAMIALCWNYLVGFTRRTDQPAAGADGGSEDV